MDPIDLDGMNEGVNHPAHYGGAEDPYEAIKVIEAWALGFCLGNTVKYISRAGVKGDRLTDLRKAAWYLNREIAATVRVPPDADAMELAHKLAINWRNIGWSDQTFFDFKNAIESVLQQYGDERAAAAREAAIEEAIGFIASGHFLHDAAPTAKFAKEVIAGLRRHFAAAAKPKSNP